MKGLPVSLRACRKRPAEPADPWESVELSAIFYHERARFSMTNEELAVLVQAGDRDKLLDLWQQIRRLVLKRADRWVVYRSGGAELEDMLQAGFIALMRAVDSFDPSAGCKFSTLYYRFMLTEFSIATNGRTAKQQRDPLHAAVSLDMLVDEGKGSTLSEFQADPDSECAFDDIERQADNASLHAALIDAVNSLCPCQRGAVMAKYFGGEPVANESQNLRHALQRLRHSSRSQTLLEYVRD